MIRKEDKSRSPGGGQSPQESKIWFFTSCLSPEDIPYWQWIAETRTERDPSQEGTEVDDLTVNIHTKWIVQVVE